MHEFELFMGYLWTVMVTNVWIWIIHKSFMKCYGYTCVNSNYSQVIHEVLWLWMHEFELFTSHSWSVMVTNAWIWIIHGSFIKCYGCKCVNLNYSQVIHEVLWLRMHEFELFTGYSWIVVTKYVNLNYSWTDKLCMNCW